VGKDVTIPLKDLRALVKLLFDSSVESNAQRLVRKKQPSEKKPVVNQYLLAVVEMMPDAKKRQKIRFAELLASLRSGQDVPASLTSFLSRETTSSTGTQTKVRQPR
jgi:hypothetical protein